MNTIREAYGLARAYALAALWIAAMVGCCVVPERWRFETQAAVLRWIWARR